MVLCHLFDPAVSCFHVRRLALVSRSATRWLVVSNGPARSDCKAAAPRSNCRSQRAKAQDVRSVFLFCLRSGRIIRQPAIVSVSVDGTYPPFKIASLCAARAGIPRYVGRDD